MPKKSTRVNLIIKIKGIKRGKTLVPENLQQFTMEQLRGKSLRELMKISKNRKKPPYNRQQNPLHHMPKIKST